MSSGTAELDAIALAADIKSVALALGFDLVGISGAEPTPETQSLRDWLAKGYGGEMHYIERRVEERVDPRRVLSTARSIVSVAIDYDTDAESSRRAGPNEGAAEALGRIARYAGGEDYHGVLKERLRALCTAIEALAPGSVDLRAYVDTGPVQERAHAARGGLGWIGKNTCLIDPELGSYVFLGVVMTSLELPFDEPVADHCGTCRACLDACPTDAFVSPYVLDARRCIAYTTIEDPGAIPEALREAHGDRVFGCDICQEVCPWNQRRARVRPGDPLGLHARLRTRPQWNAPPLAWLLSLTEGGFAEATRHSPLRRTGWRGLIRSALVAAGNAGDADLRAHVEPHARSDDPLIAEHACWALERMG